MQWCFLLNSFTPFVLDAAKAKILKTIKQNKNASLQMNYFSSGASDNMTAKMQSCQWCKLCSYIQPSGIAEQKCCTYGTAGQLNLISVTIRAASIIIVPSYNWFEGTKYCVFYV